MDILSVYDTLLVASLGGVPFDIIDSRDEVGRRIERTLFPGQPRSAWQDLGQLDGPIQINAVLIGDDFAAQAALMRNVFRSKGPWTLVHPWLGQIQVVQAPGTSLTTAMQHDELRVARISFSLVPFGASRTYVPDTLEALLLAIRTEQQALDIALQQILTPLTTSLTIIGAVESLAANMAGAIGLVAATSITLLGAVSGGVANLLALPSLINPVSYASVMVSVLSAPWISMADASVSVPPAVIAPGGATTAAAVVDPRVSVQAILALVGQLPSLAGPQSPMPSVVAVVQMMGVCSAISAASDIVFTSQQEAEAMRDQLVVALDVAAIGIAAAAASSPISIGPAWRGAQDMRSAMLADYSTMIGRLPLVTTITPPNGASVWLIAQYLAGDTPGNVVATYLDLVARNNIANPAMPPIGALETLSIAAS